MGSSFLVFVAFGAGNARLFLAFAKFGTGEGLLVYRMDARYRRRPPGVRGASSKALGAKNRLLVYRREIRCEKQASPVRDASSKARNCFLLQQTHLQKRGTASCCTRRILKSAKLLPAAPDASSDALNSFFPHRMHLRMRFSSKTIPYFDTKWQSLIRMPEGYYFTKQVSTNEYSCLSVKLSMPTLSINAYSAFLLVITHLRSFPSTSHKR